MYILKVTREQRCKLFNKRKRTLGAEIFFSAIVVDLIRNELDDSSTVSVDNVTASKRKLWKFDYYFYLITTSLSQNRAFAVVGPALRNNTSPALRSVMLQGISPASLRSLKTSFHLPVTLRAPLNSLLREALYRYPYNITLRIPWYWVVVLTETTCLLNYLKPLLCYVMLCYVMLCYMYVMLRYAAI